MNEQERNQQSESQESGGHGTLQGRGSCGAPYGKDFSGSGHDDPQSGGFYSGGYGGPWSGSFYGGFYGGAQDMKSYDKDSLLGLFMQSNYALFNYFYQNREVEDAAFAGLSDDEKNQLRKLLTKMLTFWKDTPNKGNAK